MKPYFFKELAEFRCKGTDFSRNIGEVVVILYGSSEDAWEIRRQKNGEVRLNFSIAFLIYWI